MMIFRYCLCCFGCNRNPPNDPKRYLANQSTANRNNNEVNTVPKIASTYEAALSAERPNLTGSRTNLAGSMINLTGSRTNLMGSKTNLMGSRTNLMENKTNLMGSRTNLTGSRTNLTGSKTNLTGSRTNLTESKTHLTGSRTNLMGCITNLVRSRTNLMGSKTNLTGSIANLTGSKTNLTGNKTDIARSQTDTSSSGKQFINSSSKLQNEMENDSEKSISRTPQASPAAKKKGHWTSVLMKAKRETIKSPTSVRTMASVSVLMLPTITVGSSCSSKIGSAENTSNPGTHISSRGEREVKSCSSSPKMSGGWSKSRSMMDVSCSSYSEINQNSRSTNDLARNYGLDTSLYENNHTSKSMEAVNSGWKSMDGLVNEKVFIDLPNGSIHFIPSYSSDTRKLMIQIDKIEGLAPKGVNRSKYDCIVKLTMLPNEKHVKFSEIIPAHYTLDLKECFIFTVKNPVHKVLRISVYDTEFLGKYDAVGHALFFVIDALTHEQKSHALKLYRQPMPDIRAESIKIVLHYKRPTELLNIYINEAYNLPILSGKCRSYLKLTQYNFGRKVKEIHSPSITMTKQSSYRFNVDLNIDSNALQNSYIVVSVKSQTFFKETVIGRVILGPFFYAEYGKMLTPLGTCSLKSRKVTHVFRLYQ